jgi:hypothetical protein
MRSLNILQVNVHRILAPEAESARSQSFWGSRSPLHAMAIILAAMSSLKSSGGVVEKDLRAKS